MKSVDVHTPVRGSGVVMDTSENNLSRARIESKERVASGDNYGFLIANMVLMSHTISRNMSIDSLSLRFRSRS